MAIRDDYPTFPDIATPPGSYGIQAVRADTPGALVCGECGRAWLEDITPAGRCPWEHSHSEAPRPETWPEIDTCRECGGIVPPEGVHMVPDDGELCTCALDVWLRIPEDWEESEAEANTYFDDNGFRVDWYLTAVGLVTSRYFDTYSQATAWLEAESFTDYSS